MSLDELRALAIELPIALLIRKSRGCRRPDEGAHVGAVAPCFEYSHLLGELEGLVLQFGAGQALNLRHQRVDLWCGRHLVAFRKSQVDRLWHRDHQPQKFGDGDDGVGKNEDGGEPRRCREGSQDSVTVPQDIEGGDGQATGELGRLEQGQRLQGAWRDASPVSIFRGESHIWETVFTTTESRNFCPDGQGKSGIIEGCVDINRW